MKTSWKIGRVFGAEVHLHVTLLLLIPYALLAFRPDSPANMLRIFLLLVAIFACVALHEIGHTAATRMFGYHVKSIVLWPLGGVANFDYRPEKLLPDLVITAAGPLTNLLIFAYLVVVSAAGYLVNAAQTITEGTFQAWYVNLFPVMVGLAAANFSLALFNLIPVYPLDGGQIARGLLKLVFGERHADSILLVISLPAAAALVMFGLLIGDVMVALTGLLLGLAGASLNPRLLNSLNQGWQYFFNRPNYYLSRGDFDPAVEEYTRAIQRGPERASLYAARAVVYFHLAELDHAGSDIARALALDANNYLAWLLRGELFWLQKKPAETLACYNQAIELQPKGSLAYLDRAAYYQAIGDPLRAQQDMEKGVEFGRGAPLGFLMRSILRHELGDLPGARDDALKAQRYAPQWMLVFSPAFEETLSRHLNWALDYYALALQSMPNAYQAYQGRADACLAARRPDWALVDYQRAIRRSPRRAELYLRRGLAYAHLGQREQAAADFSQAAALADRGHIRRQALAYQQNLHMPPVTVAPPTPPGPFASPAGIPAPSAPDDSSSAAAQPAP